jgi:CobQ-like glutamine amidotransferase family enzyme
MKKVKPTYHIVIGWLYPELMSTYGDRGNSIVLQKRCLWRGIQCTVLPIDFSTPVNDLSTVNVFFGGGAQDRQQSLLISDLRSRIGPVMKGMITNGTPGLFVCGSPQLLGHSYMTGDGTVLQGLGIFDMETKHFGYDTPRCIGNLVFEIDSMYKLPGIPFRKTIVGFENHGGRTYLGTGVKPFGKVIIGNGNNGEDHTEGAVLKNCIATYSHGPFLSKNPHIADWLITKTLEVKYGKTIRLQKLDDAFEWKAHEYMLKRLGYEAVTPI